MKRHFMQFISIISVILIIAPAALADDGGREKSQWAVSGPRGEFVKEQSEESPGLQKEITGLLERNPEFSNGLVDNQDCAKAVLGNVTEYPLLSAAVFKWFDRNPSDTDSAWINDYAGKRLELLATVDEKITNEMNELRKEIPGAEGGILGQEGLLVIMKNTDKYQSLSGFVVDYAKKHSDAEFIKPASTIIKLKIVEQTRDFMEAQRSEFKHCKSQEDFNEALVEASAQVKNDFSAASVPTEEISKEIKDFEAKSKKEFKEYFDKMKNVLAKLKREGEKLEDEFLAQMKKDREEFRKSLIREFDDEEEIALAMEEYDGIILLRFVDFCEDIKAKQEDPDDWSKGNKPKPDGKLTKDEKDDIRSKLTPPDPTKRPAVAAAAEPEPPGPPIVGGPAIAPAKPGPNPPPANANPQPPVAGKPAEAGPRGPAVQPPVAAGPVGAPPAKGGPAGAPNVQQQQIVVTANVQGAAATDKNEEASKEKVTAEREKIYNEALRDLEAKKSGGLTPKEYEEIQEKLKKAKDVGKTKKK